MNVEKARKAGRQLAAFRQEFERRCVLSPRAPLIFDRQPTSCRHTFKHGSRRSRFLSRARPVLLARSDRALRQRAPSTRRAVCLWAVVAKDSNGRRRDRQVLVGLGQTIGRTRSAVCPPSINRRLISCLKTTPISPTAFNLPTAKSL